MRSREILRDGIAAIPRDEGEFWMQPLLVPVSGRGISRPGPTPGAGNPIGNFGGCGSLSQPSLPP